MSVWAEIVYTDKSKEELLKINTKHNQPVRLLKLFIHKLFA